MMKRRGFWWTGLIAALFLAGCSASDKMASVVGLKNDIEKKRRDRRVERETTADELLPDFAEKKPEAESVDPELEEFAEETVTAKLRQFKEDRRETQRKIEKYSMAAAEAQAREKEYRNKLAVLNKRINWLEDFQAKLRNGEAVLPERSMARGTTYRAPAMSMADGSLPALENDIQTLSPATTDDERLMRNEYRQPQESALPGAAGLADEPLPEPQLEGPELPEMSASSNARGWVENASPTTDRGEVPTLETEGFDDWDDAVGSLPKPDATVLGGSQNPSARVAIDIAPDTKTRQGDLFKGRAPDGSTTILRVTEVTKSYAVAKPVAQHSGSPLEAGAPLTRIDRLPQ